VSKVADFQTKNTNIFDPLVVLTFCLVQRHLETGKFLVDERQFVITTDQLGADYVSFGHHLSEFRLHGEN
jgi:hypothetical protein